jgi:hypothetical protein
MIQDPRAANLLFAAPGIAHALGNSLFTVHGRARLLSMSAGDPETPRDQMDGDATAVLDGATKALGSLSVLRWIVGEARNPTPLSTVLRELIDVARVPLRDHGASVAIGGDENVDAEVDPFEVCHALLSAMRRVCEGPHAEAFTLDFRIEAQDSTASVTLRCVEPGRAGTHGRPLGLVLDALHADGILAGAAWRSGASPDLLVLAFTGLPPNLSAS